MANANRTEEEWRLLVAEQQASGQTQVAWCAEQGINYHTLIDRARRLRKQERTQGATTPVSNWVEAKATGQSEVALEVVGRLIIKVGAIQITADAEYPANKLAAVCRELVRSC